MAKFTVLVCGGRDYTNIPALNKALDEVHEEHNITALVHGACRGADTFGGIWAISKGVQEIKCPANWKYYNKPAGHIRNRAMIEHIPVDLVVAAPGGPGTAKMRSLASAAGIPITKIPEDKP